MPTRQFIIVLAAAAMIAVGVGLVIGSHRAPDEVPVSSRLASNQVASKQAPSNEAAANQSAAVSHDEAPSAPVTKAVEIPRAPATNVASNPSKSDSELKIEDEEPVTAQSSSTAKMIHGNDSLAPTAHERTDPKANDTSKLAPAVTSSLITQIGSKPIDSEFVFVSRASLLKGRHAADETAAIATLNSISSAQAQVQYSGAIDTDNDGSGEYGYFGELCGAVPCRAAPREKRVKLVPPVLASSFSRITPNGNVARNGYLFRMYLPGATVGGKMPGIAEGPGGGWNAKGALPDHDNCEIRWCCYAWPIEVGNSGTRAFSMDQEGDLLVLANTDGAYNGDDHAPAFDASSTHAGDMPEQPIPGGRYTDGRAWSAYSGQEPLIPPLVVLGPATAADVETYNKPDSKEDKVVVPRSALEQATAAALEAGVITNLRTISSAQAQAQYTHMIDTDKDGEGEYGFFGELAGTAPCRAPVGAKRTLMRPYVLSSKWGKVTNAGNVVMDGYVYRMYLPAPFAKGKSPGMSEAPGGGCPLTGPQPDPEAAEYLWAVYAWPLEAGKTGQRVFFINQEGDLHVMENKDGAYSGEEHAPTFDAAMSAKKPGDMISPPSVGKDSVDGHVWSPLY